MKFVTAISFLVFYIFSSSCYAQSEVHFVSWNIRDFGKSRSDEEIILIADLLRHADIIAIQEVVAKDPGGAQAVARLDASLDRTGSNWDYIVSEPTNDISPHKQERYAFLWKTHVARLLPTAHLVRELDSYVTREPYFVTFRIGTHNVDIINYHACTHNESYPERSEISAISEWILKQEHKNVIFAGDMNLTIDDHAFAQLLTSQFKPCLRGEKTSLKMSCNNGEYLSRAEDNVFVFLTTIRLVSAAVLDFVGLEGCANLAQLRTSYSDHLPIFFHLQF